MKNETRLLLIWTAWLAIFPAFVLLLLALVAAEDAGLLSAASSSAVAFLAGGGGLYLNEWFFLRYKAALAELPECDP